MGSNGMMILIVLVLAFLLVLVLVALAVSNLSKKNKAIPIYVDESGRDNIMPYNDEGMYVVMNTAIVFNVGSKLSNHGC